MSRFICLKYFLLSRCILIGVFIVCCTLVVKPYDSSPALVFGNSIGNSLLRLFYNYDSVHFTHVALHGYSNEKNLAFLPLMPTLARYLSGLIDLILGVFKCGDRFVSVLVSGVLFSNAVFYVNLVLLYRLFIRLGVNRERLERVIFFFCFNPGSIFQISFYSENLFFLLQLALLELMLFKKADDSLNMVSILFVLLLGTSLRSNALLLVGYFSIEYFKNLIRYYYKDSNRTLWGNTNALLRCLAYTLINKGYLIASLTLVLGFMLFTKAIPFYTLCSLSPMKSNALCPQANTIGFDSFLTAFRSNAYTYIQNKYWQSGFLMQWSLFPSNIERLLMSLPVFVISVFMVIDVFRKYFDFECLLYLDFKGFLGNPKGDRLKLKLFIIASVIHYVLTAFVLILFAHWQINNRTLLFSSPIVFFYMSDLNTNGVKYRLFRLVFLGMAVLGGCLHTSSHGGYA